MGYQLYPYRYEKIIQLSNSNSSFELFFGGKLGPVDYGVKIGNFGVPVYILQAQYYIGNTLKIQGLLGEWVDNAGNTWNFTRGGLTVTTPDGHFKTVNMPSPSQQDGKYTCMVINLSAPIEGEYFRIRTYTNSIPYEDIAQTVIKSALRTSEDEEEALELSTALFEQSVDNYDVCKIIYAPFYNTFENNDYPIKCMGAISTNRISETFENGSELSGSSTATIFDGSFTGFVNPSETNPDDPYQEGGTTNTGGGNGTFDPSGDVVDVPSLPLLSALDTGFVTMWRPTKTELTNLYNYLWSNAFDLESFKKIFANPMDTFLGFGIIPLNPTISGSSELKVGNIGTGISLSRIGNQYYEIDCGSVDIPEFFGSYLDYEPYSTLDLFLPYIGSIPISIDDVRTNPPREGSIKVIYHVDILSGSCVAYIRCKNKKGIWTTCYQYNGSVFTPLPITGNDFTSLYQSVISAVGSAVGLATNIGSKNFGGAIGNAANIAGSVMNSKPTINRSGSMGSSGGRLGSQIPYLIMNLPKQAVAFAQNTFTGYPAHITNSVRSLTGYTEFEQIWIENVPATESELSEIESILTSGVIL